MVYGDSALVINQLNKDWSCSSEKMDAYCAEIKKLEGKFYGIEYHHMVRDQNQLADHLSKIGSSRTVIPPRVFIQYLLAPSIKEEKEVQGFPLPSSWYLRYLRRLLIGGNNSSSTSPAPKYPPTRLKSNA